MQLLRTPPPLRVLLPSASRRETKMRKMKQKLQSSSLAFSLVAAWDPAGIVPGCPIDLFGEFCTNLSTILFHSGGELVSMRFRCNYFHQPGGINEQREKWGGGERERERGKMRERESPFSCTKLSVSLSLALGDKPLHFSEKFLEYSYGFFLFKNLFLIIFLKENDRVRMPFLINPKSFLRPSSKISGSSPPLPPPRRFLLPSLARLMSISYRELTGA